MLAYTIVVNDNGIWCENSFSLSHFYSSFVPGIECDDIFTMTFDANISKIKECYLRKEKRKTTDIKEYAENFDGKLYSPIWVVCSEFAYSFCSKQLATDEDCCLVRINSSYLKINKIASLTTIYYAHCEEFLNETVGIYHGNITGLIRSITKITNLTKSVLC